MVPSGLATTAAAPTNGQGALTKEEMRRYSRHILIPEVGVDGQRRLKESRVLIVGLGGLGSPLAMYLAAAGVGTLGFVEFDTVDDTNLQRQVLYAQDEVGQPKLERAEARVLGINPNVTVNRHAQPLTSQNARELVAQYDVVVDGTDNFPTRYLVNDACVLEGKPNVYGSIYRFEGQVSVFWAEKGPCYRCLYPNPPPPGLVPSCAEGGVLGVLPGVVGSMQANEAIKVLLGIGDPLIGRLLLYDALDMTFDTVNLRKDPDCVVCGPEPSVTELIDYEEFCGVPAPSNETQTTEDENMTEDGIQVSPTTVKERLDRGEDVFLLDVREPNEAQIATIQEATLIPMNDVPRRLDEIPRDKDVVVYCRSGVRSMQVTQFLQGQGFERVKNLQGGIHAWIDQVDPSQPKY